MVFPRFQGAMVIAQGTLFFNVFKDLTPAGIEPATYGLEIRCSIQLSYGVVRVGGRPDRPPVHGRIMRDQP